jgi:cell division septation protein DedD
VSAASTKATEVKGGTPRGYWVQLGVFKDAKHADELTRKLRGQGFPIQVMRVTRSDRDAAIGGVPAGIYHLVRAGSFGDRSAAIAARGSLSARGYSGFVSEGIPK